MPLDANHIGKLLGVRGAAAQEQLAHPDATARRGRRAVAMEQKRYSQERFARHAGFERSNYGAIERGEFNVRFDTLVKVAAGLDMTVAALCEKAKV
jgi:DNA-binding XRE family transcriptional regulator